VFWFALEERTLSSFSDPQSPKSLLVIPLGPGTYAGERKQKKTELNFLIKTPSKTYKLEADTKELKINWVQSINRVIHDLHSFSTTSESKPGKQILTKTPKDESTVLQTNKVIPPLPDLPELNSNTVVPELPDFTDENSALKGETTSENVDQNSSEDDAPIAQINFSDLDKLEKDLDVPTNVRIEFDSLDAITQKYSTTLNQAMKSFTD